MSAEVWGVVAAVAGVGAALLTVFVAAFLWLISAIHRLGQEIRTEMREERRAQQAENQEERRQRQAEIQEERRAREAQIQEERRAREEESRRWEAEIQEERRRREEERKEREAATQRFFDALHRHRHDASDSTYVPADDD